jgi:splicing factor 3A subunit 3
MYNNIFEYARGMHEDFKRLQRMIVRDLKNVSYAHREKIQQSTRVKTMLDKMQALAKNLVLIYSDSDLSWKKEIDLLSGQGVDKDLYTLFYERFKDITSFYRNFFY